MPERDLPDSAMLGSTREGPWKSERTEKKRLTENEKGKEEKAP